MKLNTGSTAFPIVFDNGDSEIIYFKPTDPDLMVRLARFGERTREQIADLGDIVLNADGVPETESQVEMFDAAQKIIKKEMDVAFGGDVSAKVFKHCSPFAIVDGRYFVEQFLEAIAPEIKRAIEKASGEANVRVARHTDKYKA